MPKMVLTAIVALCAALASACTAPQNSSLDDSTAETRAHLEEEMRFQELRQQMRGYSRELALSLPIACDAAVHSVPDMETKSDLLALAASGPIYAAVRCSAPDPRAGLADLTVTFTTLLELLESYTVDPAYKGVAPVTTALRPVVQHYTELSEKWLPPELLKKVKTEIKAAVSAEEARIRTSTISSAALAASVTVPAGLQIRSSFIDFNDNGLIGYGLNEAHFIRLSAQELADCMALLPMSLDYHARRASLWGMQQPEMVELKKQIGDATKSLESMKQLESLKALESLDQLQGLVWKLGGALVLALCAQAVILGIVLRRRG